MIVGSVGKGMVEFVFVDCDVELVGWLVLGLSDELLLGIVLLFWVLLVVLLLLLELVVVLLILVVVLFVVLFLSPPFPPNLLSPSPLVLSFF